MNHETVLHRMLELDRSAPFLNPDERAALTAAIDALQRQGEVVAEVIATPEVTHPHAAGDTDIAWKAEWEHLPVGTKLYALPPQPPTAPSPFDICPKCRDEYACCECPQPPTGEQTP